MRRIVSVWLPELAIERMARIDSATMPADKPAVLVVSGPRGIRITAANTRARASGVHPGMALSDARAGIASLIVHQAEPVRDRALLMRLARWAGRYGPVRNRLGADGLWVDIAGVAHLFGGEDSLLADLVRRLAASGLTARVGLADTLGAAWALARHGPCERAARPLEPSPEGLPSETRHFHKSVPGASPWSESARGKAFRVRPQGEEPPLTTLSGSIASPGGMRAALAGLPVAALRLEEGAITLLRRLGLARIGQLYGLPRSALERRFRDMRKKDAALPAQAAAAVLMRLDQALGLAAEPLIPLGEPPVLCVRRAYPEPLATARWLESEVESLAGELTRALQDASLGARRIRLSLHRADGTVAEARVGFSTPCRDAAHMTRLLAERLETLDAGLGVDVLVLDAASVERREAVAEALGTGGERGMRADPAQLVDRLVNRLGPDRVTTLQPRASHLPERAQIRIPALSEAVPELASWPAEHTGDMRRPPLLLGRPEPITVTAEIPEGPPACFTWRRVMRKVRKAEGPERLAPEWWRELDRIAPRARLEAEARSAIPHTPGQNAQDEEREYVGPRPSRPRDYYRLEDWEGARYWVFREGLYMALAEAGEPRWYMHGVFA